MRLGVLDVGSNTVHLLVVDAYPGARPLPAFSHKAELHLAEHLEDGGRISAKGEELLGGFVAEAIRIAEDKGVEDFIGFATSAVRDAVNGEAVLTRITKQTDVRVTVLAGEDEARLTFLAARRWFGWSSGRLLVLDIGGGSLEIASGIDEDPDVAVSLPLGAGLAGTRDWLRADPPTAAQTRDLRKHVRTEIARTVGGIDALRRARSCGRHLENIPPAGQDRGRRAVQRWALRAAGPVQHGHDHVGGRAAHDDAGGTDQAAGCLGEPGPAAVRRGHRGRRRDGSVRCSRTGDLPRALREGVILRRLDLLSEQPRSPVRPGLPPGRPAVGPARSAGRPVMWQAPRGQQKRRYGGGLAGEIPGQAPAERSA